MEEIKKLISIAQGYIGVTEEGGDNRGKQVEEFQRAVDGKAQREAWCMAFVQYCIKKVKEAFPKLNVILFASEHCMTVWNKTPKSQRLSVPEVGSICIWQFYSKGKATASGHTGIVYWVSQDKKSFKTIEGNTGPSGEIEREGDGVYSKTRTIAGSASMKVVGFLKPF